MSTPNLSLSQVLIVLFLFFDICICSLSTVNRITYLPGFHGALPFRLETGYVTMDEESGAELFYYFVESEGNPPEDPLLLWLTGGPGCSGFAGLAMHMGPLRFKVEEFNSNLPTLVANPYSWTKNASMIFLDWPVGTGYSYSTSEKDYASEDFHAVESIHKFLIKWLLNHQLFLSNPFYMGGESYGGKMATLVTHKIVEGNDQGQQPLINIKGYLIGNAITGELVDKNSQVAHAYGLGIISDELYKFIQTSCVGEDYLTPKDAICAAHLKTFNEFLSEINVFGVLDPICSDELPSIEEMAGDMNISSEEIYTDQFLRQPWVPDTSCITAELLSNYWANNLLVRKALKIKEGSVGRWLRCNFDVNTYHYRRSIPSSLPYHLNLTTRGYRALVYSGDHDLKVPYVGTLEWIRSLRFSVLDPWRSWHAGGQVAGYTVSFSNNLTFATVKGAGHVAPDKRPMQSFVMFVRWISDEVL